MTTAPTNPAELPPHLEAVIGQIRAALLPGADAATKGAAAHACRVLLGVLNAQPGQPLQVPTGSAAPAATPAAPAPAAPTMEAPIDRFLARLVEKFGGDVSAADDPSVPFVGLRHGSALFAQFAALGGNFGGVR